MHWNRLIALCGMMLLAAAADAAEPVAAAPQAAPVRAADATPGPTLIQPAPGGGEMIVLPPESRYIIRGHVDAGGQIRTQCQKPPGQSGAPGVTR